MLNLELSWPQAAIASGCLFAAAGAAAAAGNPRLRSGAAVAAEAGTLLGLFALWQFAGSFSMLSPAGALPRARWIWHAERVVHLPSEAALQRLFLPYPLLVQACNLYYLSLHFAGLLACLSWLFARHRGQYRQVRTTVAGFTACSLLIQFIPVAPPRMLPADHMIDTGVHYGQSVYGSVAGFNPDQLSAMPSVHVGWALIVALAVIRAGRGRWRWLALGYPALTTLVVVVTANHFWFDAIAAVLLVGAVLVIQRAARAAGDAFGAPLANPSAAWQALSLPAPRGGEAAEAPAAAAAGAEAQPAAPSWRRPPHGPPVQPAPEYGPTPSGSR
jgi:hypothetical protein